MQRELSVDGGEGVDLVGVTAGEVDGGGVLDEVEVEHTTGDGDGGVEVVELEGDDTGKVFGSGT